MKKGRKLFQAEKRACEKAQKYKGFERSMAGKTVISFFFLNFFSFLQIEIGKVDKSEKSET